MYNSTDWNKLNDAHRTCIQLIDSKKWNEADTCWIQQVGGAQLLLPAHVINEYCHPTRSFSPRPDFTKPEPNGAWRTCQTDEGEWFTCQYNGGSLGVKFAVARGSNSRAVAGAANNIIISIPILQLAKLDQAGVRALYDTRIQQCSRLLTELAPAKQLKAS